MLKKTRTKQNNKTKQTKKKTNIDFSIFNKARFHFFDTGLSLQRDNF